MNNYQAGPDLADLKDGMKDGVNRVAGKLSQLASGIMSSIQVSAVRRSFVCVHLCVGGLSLEFVVSMCCVKQNCDVL